MAPSFPRIIETFQVSPPAGSVPETSIPLTFFDVMWLNFAPVERLFFYPFKHPTSYFTSSCLPLLKSSLSLSLQSFFPLAGSVRLAPETTDKYEICYADGDSVVVTVAEYDTYDELFSDQPRKLSKLKSLVPCLSRNESDGLRPVLAIQVTLFPSHGLVIGTSVLHSACDGSAYVNFIHTWAMICRMSNFEMIPAQVPVSVEIDRSIIPDPDGSIYSTILNDISGSTDFNINVTQPSHEKYLASFQLKREHIQLLKEILLREAEKRKVTVRCSSAVVIYAFIWVGYVKAKLSSMSETEEAYSVFAIDHSRSLQPPLPESYFGNRIGPGIVEAKSKHLVVGPDGFFEACQAIGKTFDEVKKVGILDANDWGKISLEIGSKNPFSTSGSLRFKVYDVDFGWGKPSKVDIVSISYSGAMGVAQSREQDGVEIELCFTERENEVFTNYFTEGLQHLSH